MTATTQRWYGGNSSCVTRDPVLCGGRAGSFLIASACAWVLLLGFSRTADAQPASASASAIKAAFVLNFMKFVEWPSTAFVAPNAPLVLCVSGANGDLAEALQSLEGRTIQGRVLSIRNDLRTGDFQACNAAYLGADAMQMPRDSIDKVNAVLTLGDYPGFAAAGGMIGLYSEDGKIRFEINPYAVQRSALKISSQLMKLARIAEDRRSGELK